MAVLVILASIFVGFGIYNLSCAFVDVPTAKTSRAMMLAKKQTGTGDEKLIEVYITKIAEKLSPILKMDPIKRSKLKAALHIAGMNLTPESYTMKALLMTLLTLLAGLFLLLLIPMAGFAIMGLSVLMWFSSYHQVFDIVKKRKKLIEAELPRFAVSIQQSLSTDRDVLKLLISYRRIAGPHLGQELDTTIADMKTGNYENALLRLQNKVGSTMLSDIVRGLIGTLRGDDQQMYFKMLVFDMRQIEQNNLKKEAAKRPKQMQKYSMMMLFCILLIYVVVLSVEVVSSLGGFF
jgi:CHASE3 domain sensor protein